MAKLDGSDDAAKAYLAKAWLSTCRVVLWGEVGSLWDFEKYLTRYPKRARLEKSSISGKDVVVFGLYSKNARFIAEEEAAAYLEMLKGTKLNVNDIKDIDSAVDALSENIAYAGNIVLGKSAFVSQSTRVVDSFYVYRSSDVVYSKNIAFCEVAKYSECVFGCASAGKGTKFAISCGEPYEASRLFECFHAYDGADCFYSANLESCQECMFCFNVKNLRYAVGNVVVGREEYLAFKKRMLSSIASEIEAKKSLRYGIFNVCEGKKN